MQTLFTKRFLLSLLLSGAVTLSMLAYDARADVPESQVAEVNHLINFIKTSDCLLTRNGTEHSPEKSVAHIQKKYNYFRDRIKSTEDYIENSATKSTMSGKYYTVTCPGKETIRTKDWLLEELVRFRSK